MSVDFILLVVGERFKSLEGVQPKEAAEGCLEHVSSAPVNFYFSGGKAEQ